MIKTNNNKNNNNILTITSKQYDNYINLCKVMWQLVGKTVPLNYKKKRSAGFKMVRSEAWNLVMNKNEKNGKKLYERMWHIVDTNVAFENKKVRSIGFALARELTAKIVG